MLKVRSVLLVFCLHTVLPCPQTQAQILVTPTSCFNTVADRVSGSWLEDEPGPLRAGDTADRNQIVAFLFFDLHPYSSGLGTAEGMALTMNLASTIGHPNRLEVDFMGFFPATPVHGETRLVNLQGARFSTDVQFGTAPGPYTLDLSPLTGLVTGMAEGQQVLGLRLQQSSRENGNSQADYYQLADSGCSLSIAAVPEPAWSAAAAGLGLIAWAIGMCPHMPRTCCKVPVQQRVRQG